MLGVGLDVLMYEVDAGAVLVVVMISPSKEATLLDEALALTSLAFSVFAFIIGLIMANRSAPAMMTNIVTRNTIVRVMLPLGLLLWAITACASFIFGAICWFLIFDFERAPPKLQCQIEVS